MDGWTRDFAPCNCGTAAANFETYVRRDGGPLMARVKYPCGAVRLYEEVNGRWEFSSREKACPTPIPSASAKTGVRLGTPTIGASHGS